MYNGPSPPVSPPHHARPHSVASRLGPVRPGISPAVVRISLHTAWSRSSKFSLCTRPYLPDLPGPPSFRIPDLSLALKRQVPEAKSRLVSASAGLASREQVRF